MNATCACRSAPEDHSGVDGPLAVALADQLEELTARLSDLAYDLGSDPDTLRRHLTSLQAIDLVTQIQMAVADVLRSTEPYAERLARVPLEQLSGHLREAVGEV